MAIVVLGFAVASGLIAAIALGWFIHLVRRQSLRIEERIEGIGNQLRIRQRAVRHRESPGSRRGGLPAGSILNDFELPNVRGGKITFSQWRGQRIAVLFLQPSCPFSRQLTQRLTSTMTSAGIERRQLIIVSNGDEGENRELFRDLPPHTPILLQQANELARVWRVSGTPAAYLFDDQGVTEREIAQGKREILEAFALDSGGSIADEPDPRKVEITRFTQQFDPILRRIETGENAPLEAIAPYLDDNVVTDMTLNRTLLLFSDPRCAPCRALAAELEPRFRRFPSGLLLLMASRGQPDHLAQLRSDFDLTFPIVAHSSGAVNRAFGTVETPAALLIDRDGVVIVPPEVGGTAILALVDRAMEGKV